MFYILAALTGELGFLTVNVLNKRLRSRDFHTLTVFGMYGLLAPLWLAMAAALFARGNVALNAPYILILCFWVILVMVNNFGSIYLTRFQSLSEATGYRFGFTVLCALLADILFFHKEFHGLRLVAASMTIAGGLILSFSRQKAVPDFLHMPLIKRLPALLLLSAVEVSMYTVYKLAAAYQTLQFSHVALTQSAAFFLFFCGGQNSFRMDWKAGKIAGRYLTLFCAVLFVACLAEGFALIGLPVTFIVLFCLIRSAVYAMHDMKTGELAASPVNALSIALIVAGIVWISLLTA